MLKIISCAGYGNTGSSIITDYFQEFSCITSLAGSKFEFTLLHENDGIRDLEYALLEGNRLKTDLAIKRFLQLVHMLNCQNPSGPNYKDFFNGKFLEYVHDYIKSLGIITWQYGWWHRIFECKPEKKILRYVMTDRFNREVRKCGYDLYEPDAWRPSFTNYTEEFYCFISRENFINRTKYFLNKLFLEIAGDTEYVFIDQLFPANVNSGYLKYFDFAKVIIVDRDPRDLYFANKVFWGSGYIPSENVKTFVNWFKMTRKCAEKEKDILHINFEDMVYEPEKTQEKICEFTGLNKRYHDKPKTHLFIEKSRTNTMFYENTLLTDSSYEDKLKQDITYIETELKDHLFPFENYAYSKNKKTVSFIFEQKLKNLKKQENLIFFPEIIFVLAKKCMCYLLNKYFKKREVA